MNIPIHCSLFFSLSLKWNEYLDLVRTRPQFESSKSTSERRYYSFERWKWSWRTKNQNLLSATIWTIYTASFYIRTWFEHKNWLVVFFIPRWISVPRYFASRVFIWFTVFGRSWCEIQYVKEPRLELWFAEVAHFSSTQEPPQSSQIFVSHK